MTTLLSTAPLTLLLALSAIAQGDPGTAGRPQSFVLEAGTHAIPALVDRVAAFLGHNILYNASELGNAGDVRLTQRTEVDAGGCWELFHTLLHHKGLAIISTDQKRGFHEVISMNGPRQREISNNATLFQYNELETYSKLKASPVLTSMPLKNINVTIALNSLRPFFATSGSSGSGSVILGSVGNNSELLLQGYGSQVAAAVRLLQLVDVRSDEPSETVQVVRLEHANPTEVVASLDAALSNRKAAQQQSAQMQGLPMPLPNPRAVAHPALNAVILMGSTASVRESLELVSKLDAPAVAPNAETVALRQMLGRLEARLSALEGQNARK